MKNCFEENTFNIKKIVNKVLTITNIHKLEKNPKGTINFLVANISSYLKWKIFENCTFKEHRSKQVFEMLIENKTIIAESKILFSHR